MYTYTLEGGEVGLRSDQQIVKDMEGRVKSKLGEMVWYLECEHYKERKHGRSK